MGTYMKPMHDLTKVPVTVIVSIYYYNAQKEFLNPSHNNKIRGPIMTARDHPPLSYLI